MFNLRASGGTTTEGILISRIRYDQQRAEFDRQINQYLLNVETAYWNLYAAYYNLYASEEVLTRAAYLLSVVYERTYVARQLRVQQYKQTEADIPEAEEMLAASESADKEATQEMLDGLRQQHRLTPQATGTSAGKRQPGCDSLQSASPGHGMLLTLRLERYVHFSSSAKPNPVAVRLSAKTRFLEYISNTKPQRRNVRSIGYSKLGICLDVGTWNLEVIAP